MMLPAEGGARDRGSATVLMVAVVATVFVLGGAVLTAAAVRVSEVRAQGAADAAATAAAAALVGLVPGAPCIRAVDVAAASGARVTACDTGGGAARVAVVVRSGAVAVTADAVAGPAPDPSGRGR